MIVETNTAPTRRAIMTAAVASPALAVIGNTAAHAANPARDREWDRLVAAYRFAAQSRDAIQADDDEAPFDASVNVVSAALSAACKHPVTTIAALAEKCELLSAEYPDADCLDGYDCAYIMADVRRLAARKG